MASLVLTIIYQDDIIFLEGEHEDVMQEFENQALEWFSSSEYLTALRMMNEHPGSPFTLTTETTTLTVERGV